MQDLKAVECMVCGMKRHVKGKRFQGIRSHCRSHGKRKEFSFFVDGVPYARWKKLKSPTNSPSKKQDWTERVSQNLNEMIFVVNVPVEVNLIEGTAKIVRVFDE